MSQPTSTQVHVNRPLTNISIAYMQNQANFIADRVFPVVPVDKQADIYTVYTKNDWFRDEAQARAAGTESAGSGYNLDNSNTYYCVPYAFHKDVADQIRANADSHLNLDREATEFVTQRLLVRRERLWATNFFATSKWGTDKTGGTDFTVWSNFANSDPASDVEAGKVTILQNTGFEPNTLVLGYSVFSKLKQHPVIKDQFKYVSSQSITEDMMAQFFGVDRVLVAKATYATNHEGETAAYSFVQGKHALLCYVNPRPSLMSPSAGYVFGWRGISQGMGVNMAMKRFRLEHLESDRVEGQFAYDMKVVGSDLGYFFSGAVS